MIALEDCIAMSGLSRTQILALAQHEHIPEITAAALASFLLSQPDGCRKIAAMIADDVTFAEARGDSSAAADWREALRAFAADRPEAYASLRAQACLGGTDPQLA